MGILSSFSLWVLALAPRYSGSNMQFPSLQANTKDTFKRIWSSSDDIAVLISTSTVAKAQHSKAQHSPRKD